MKRAFNKLIWFSEIFPKIYQDEFENELQNKGSIRTSNL